MKNKIDTLKRQLADELDRVNFESLSALIAKNGGLTSYWFDIGGDERGCHNCSLFLMCKNGNRIRASYVGFPAQDYQTVEAKFKSFIKRFNIKAPYKYAQSRGKTVSFIEQS